MVLFASLSSQLSSIVGIEYFNSESFLVCLAVAVAAACLAPALDGARVRFAASVFVLLSSFVWLTLMVLVQGVGASAAPSWALMAYAFVGRSTTLLVNIEWNYRFVREGSPSAPGLTCAAVFLSLAVFLAAAAVGGFVAQTVLMGCILVSSVLAAVIGCLEWRAHRTEEPSVGEGSRLVANSGEADVATPTAVGVEPRRGRTSHPVSAESHAVVRALYFGSRALYGVALALIVSLASIGGGAIASPGLAACMALLAAVPCAFSWLGLLTVRGARAAAIATPVIATLLVVTSFWQEPAEGMLCQAALLAEVCWTTQNLFQLASYRDICDMAPARFATLDYAAQMVTYYPVVWALTSSGALSAYLSARGVQPQTFGVYCCAALMAFCVCAMVRHAVKYLPSTQAGRMMGACRTAGEGPDESVDLSHVAGVQTLTPRERDVLTLMAQGYSRSYIGKVLYISPDTVKVHARHIYAKLGVTSKDELIALCRREG